MSDTFSTPYNYRLLIITAIFSAWFKNIIVGNHSLWNTHIYSRNIRYRSFTCWEIIWNIKRMLKLAPLGRKSKTLNDLILVSMPRRHSMSWAHNKSSPQRPHRGDYRRARPRHLDIVQLTQKSSKVDYLVDQSKISELIKFLTFQESSLVWH